MTDPMSESDVKICIHGHRIEGDNVIGIKNKRCKTCYKKTRIKMVKCDKYIKDYEFLKLNVLNKYEIKDNCHIYLGGKDKDGYGLYTKNLITNKVHRLSWMVANKSDIPTGMVICHKCDNPSCINPEHLFLGTHSDNVIDCVKKKRQKEARKTHCKNGHEYNAQNTRLWKNKRICKACVKINNEKKHV